MIQYAVRWKRVGEGYSERRKTFGNSLKRMQRFVCLLKGEEKETDKSKAIMRDKKNKYCEHLGVSDVPPMPPLEYLYVESRQVGNWKVDKIIKEKA